MLFEDALTELEVLTGFKPQSSGREWIKARCPAHKDRTPSLAVKKDAESGHAVFHCFAGCTQEEVLSVLTGGQARYDPSTLPPPDQNSKGKPPWQRLDEIEATYDYVDESGVLIMQKVRFRGKDFIIRHPDSRIKDGWSYSRGGYVPMLYNLPGVIKARVIFIVEGEKDADNLISRGVPATCTSAPGEWVAEHIEYFKNKHVCILADNDKPGWRAGQEAFHALADVPASKVFIATLPGLAEGGDVTDWLNLGNTVEDLIRLYYQRYRNI